jgi:hypothetical protein
MIILFFTLIVVLPGASTIGVIELSLFLGASKPVTGCIAFVFAIFISAIGTGLVQLARLKEQNE